jgi:hypothetical protein
MQVLSDDNIVDFGKRVDSRREDGEEGEIGENQSRIAR